MAVTIRIDSEELYDALREAGVTEANARRATASVVSAATLEHLVSKEDLRLAVQELQLAMAAQASDLTKRIGRVSVIVVTAITVATAFLGLLIGLFA